MLLLARDVVRDYPGAELPSREMLVESGRDGGEEIEKIMVIQTDSIR